MAIQFPPQIISDITIYPRYVSLITGNHINVRVVLRGCFWNDDSVSIFGKTGIQVLNSVTLFIPYREEVTGRKYVTPDEWAALPESELENHWSINPRQLPLVVKGDNPHEFNWGTSAQVTTQENQFMSANPTVRRLRDVNEQLFGMIDKWHLVVRA